MTSPGIAELKRSLEGHVFPGGEFVVEDYERWLSHDAMQAAPLPEGVLHPVWILLGALRGMGVTLDELIELGGSSPDDGVVFGETDYEQHAPLRTGVTYRVSGGVKSVTRRAGKQGGVFDVLVVELRIDEAGGAPAAVSRQSFIFFRDRGS
ncbi:MAG: hypothetical protein U0R50_16300 [Gaiellales bacterium]